jgi:ParB family chromosome partitioning protein
MEQDELKAVKRKKQALGRGLDALLGDDSALGQDPREYVQCDINIIYPNPFQPRKYFPDEQLDELAQSIREQGIIQPLVVRKQSSGAFELIAGERRLRAAKLAGLDHVPVIIKDLSDTQVLEISIVENIQRQNLNPIEEGEAYHQLITQFGLTQDEAAQRVGKSRSAVANFLRLRQLPEKIKQSIGDQSLSMGHARALLGAGSSDQQIAAWQMVLAKGLSVRETEKLVNRLRAGETKKQKEMPDSLDVYLTSVSDDLARRFGTKVQIKKFGKKGKVEIEFYNDTDLNRLIEILKNAQK